MLTDQQARELILRGYAIVHPGVEPTLPELQYLGAIGKLEGTYGTAFGNAHNWGGLHACKAPGDLKIGDHYRCNPGPYWGGDAVVVQESKEGNVATGGYLAGMRAYPDDERGSCDTIRLVSATKNYSQAWELVKAGKGREAVFQFKKSGYFGLPAEDYSKAVERVVREIAARVDGGKVALSFGTSSPSTPDSTDTGKKVGGGAILALLGAGLVWILARRNRNA